MTEGNPVTDSSKAGERVLISPIPKGGAISPEEEQMILNAGRGHGDYRLATSDLGVIFHQKMVDAGYRYMTPRNKYAFAYALLAARSYVDIKVIYTIIYGYEAVVSATDMRRLNIVLCTEDFTWPEELIIVP